VASLLTSSGRREDDGKELATAFQPGFVVAPVGFGFCFGSILKKFATNLRMLNLKFEKKNGVLPKYCVDALCFTVRVRVRVPVEGVTRNLIHMLWLAYKLWEKGR